MLHLNRKDLKTFEVKITLLLSLARLATFVLSLLRSVACLRFSFQRILFFGLDAYATACAE